MKSRSRGCYDDCKPGRQLDSICFLVFRSLGFPRYLALLENGDYLLGRDLATHLSRVLRERPSFPPFRRMVTRKEKIDAPPILTSTDPIDADYERRFGLEAEVLPGSPDLGKVSERKPPPARKPRSLA
jgi:hypothetical protein